jgi:hypothetical protein
MNEQRYKQYKQNDRVYFTVGDISGWGKVCGQVGPILIVELETVIANYPFTHTYVMDVQVSVPTDASSVKQ